MQKIQCNMTHMRRPGEIPEKAPDTGVLTDSSFSRRVYVFTYSDLCCVSSWDGRNVCLHLAHFFAAYSVNAAIRDLLSSEQLNPGLVLFFFFFFSRLSSHFQLQKGEMPGQRTQPKGLQQRKASTLS